MTEKFNVRDALTTDKHALDEEWLRQPRLMDEATLALSDVQYERDRAQAKWSYEKGKLAVAIRSAPVDFPSITGNVTDAKVKELVAADEYLYKLERKIHEWEAELTATEGLKWAVSQRKAQLQDLARLFLASYFSSPHISNREREAIERMADDQSQSEVLQSNVRMRKRAEKKE